MKIVVAGGTGLVGRKLVEKFIADGHTVIVLTRGASRVDSPQLRFLSWDPEKWQIPIQDLEGSDAIVNLAGTNINDKRWDEKFKRVLVDSRLFSTRCLIKACEKMKSKPKCFVSASAVGFYGNAKDRVCVEDSTSGSDFMATLCVGWEKEASRAVDLGIRTVVARLGIVLSSQGGALAEMLPIFRWGLGGRLGSGQQWMSWVHIDDVTKAIDWFLNRDKISGTFNVTAPNPVTNRQFTKSLGKALHRPTFLYVPPFALKKKVGELSEVLLSGQKVLPQKCMRFGFQFSYPQLDGALVQIIKNS